MPYGRYPAARRARFCRNARALRRAARGTPHRAHRAQRCGGSINGVSSRRARRACHPQRADCHSQEHHARVIPRSNATRDLVLTRDLIAAPPEARRAGRDGGVPRAAQCWRRAPPSRRARRAVTRWPEGANPRSSAVRTRKALARRQRPCALPPAAALCGARYPTARSARRVGAAYGSMRVNELATRPWRPSKFRNNVLKANT